MLREHVEVWSAPVYAHSVWERDVKLTRRTFGDDGAGVEAWNGPPVPLLKKAAGARHRTPPPDHGRWIPAQSEAGTGGLVRADRTGAERRGRGAHLLRRHL